MPEPQPKAWLCKHCNERVDPTMGLCWQCGYDREGLPPEAEASAIAAGLIDRCPACQYDLRGNPEATNCPECGQRLPQTANEFILYGAPASEVSGPVGSFFREPYRVLLLGVVVYVISRVLKAFRPDNSGQSLAPQAHHFVDIVIGFVMLGSGLIAMFGLCALIIHGFRNPEKPQAMTLVYDNHNGFRAFMESSNGRSVKFLILQLLILKILSGGLSL